MSCTLVTAIESDEMWPKQIVALPLDPFNQQFLKSLLKKTDLHPRKCRNVDCIISYTETTERFTYQPSREKEIAFFSYSCSVLGRK
jgi:hypothetical protein